MALALPHFSDHPVGIDTSSEPGLPGPFNCWVVDNACHCPAALERRIAGILDESNLAMESSPAVWSQFSSMNRHQFSVNGRICHRV